MLNARNIRDELEFRGCNYREVKLKNTRSRWLSVSRGGRCLNIHRGFENAGREELDQLAILVNPSERGTFRYRRAKRALHDFIHPYIVQVRDGGKQTRRNRTLSQGEENVLNILRPIIKRAEHMYMKRVRKLEDLRAVHGAKMGINFTEQAVRTWLDNVRYIPSNKYRAWSTTHASAYNADQKITINAAWVLAMQEHATSAKSHPHMPCDMQQFTHRMLDLLLHELGHLFTGHFFGYSGHGQGWKAVGRAVGYVTYGSTSPQKRMALINANCVPLWRKLEGANVGETVPMPVAAESEPKQAKQPNRHQKEVLNAMADNGGYGVIRRDGSGIIDERRVRASTFTKYTEYGWMEQCTGKDKTNMYRLTDAGWRAIKRQPRS